MLEQAELMKVITSSVDEMRRREAEKVRREIRHATSMAKQWHSAKQRLQARLAELTNSDSEVK